MSDSDKNKTSQELSFVINGQNCRGIKEQTILDAASQYGIYIPTLCHHPDLRPAGICGLCIVEIEGKNDFQPSCDTLIEEGMVINTGAPGVVELRRKALEKILARHPYACLVCDKKNKPECSPLHLFDQSGPRPCALCNKSGRCELERVAAYIGLKEVTLTSKIKNLPIQTSDPLFDRDYSLCVLCGRCVRICKEVRGVGAIDYIYGDNGTIIGVGPVSEESYTKSGCKYCGACVEICPTAALRDKNINIMSPQRQQELIPCRYNCPAETDIPRFIDFITRGKPAEAAAVLREKLTFPGVLGRVCHHPCETSCRRGQLNQSVAIKALKRAIIEQDNYIPGTFVKKYSTNKAVAIVGSGPTGLTAAYYLAKLGHSVTVYEACTQLGGMMRLGIPEYRLPRDVLNREIQMICDSNVNIKTGIKITSLNILFDLGCQAVLVCTGAHHAARLNIEGENNPGVIQGIEFLREINMGNRINIGKRVAVIGGGNVAVDAARVAVRIGARCVSVIYRRARAEMPANFDDIAEAEAEGVDFLINTAPFKISHEKGALSLVCVKLKPGKKWDAKGKRVLEPAVGSEFILSFDTVIVAVGQSPEIMPDFDLVNTHGYIQVDPDSLATSKDGVFAGGDAVSGPSSVIDAVAAGRKAAISIDKFLGGTGIIDEIITPSDPLYPWLDWEEGFADRQRVQIPYLPVERRNGNFQEVELGLNEKMIVDEARRCLKCSLRMEITSMR
ncbi:MAG: FAD-dependent oxidoreductase [Bacillota bacterium]